MIKKSSLVIFLICIVFTLTAVESIKLIDVPTAGMLQKGEAQVYAKIYRNNGLMLGANVGLLPRFMFGVGFGGENVVGNNSPEWQERVEFSAKLRILDESTKYPAFVIGFDSMGHGSYKKDTNRYDIKSKGFYGTFSKNYVFLGNLGFHGGLNYSLEKDDGDDDLNFFIGIEKTIGPMLTICGEYDVANNDNDSNLNGKDDLEYFGEGRGFLNVSAELKFSDEIQLKLQAYDILENHRSTMGFDRAVFVTYNIKY